MLLSKDLQIVGVIDWEFTYAAPTEFSSAPPWWLLVEQPEYWPDGIEAWIDVYGQRLQTFLEGLIEREDALIYAGRMEEKQRLSGPMQESCKTVTFGSIMQHGRISHSTLFTGRRLTAVSLGLLKTQRMRGKRESSFLTKMRNRPWNLLFSRRCKR